MIISLEEIVEEAQERKIALGAFNIFNLESTLAVAQAALEAKRPVIIQVSETTIDYAGLKAITHIVKTVAKNQAKEAKIALHLDHGQSFLSVVECIKAGFSSIMIDASGLPFDENVSLTKKAVLYAHKHRVWAQGELGEIPRIPGEIEELKKNPDNFLTDPDLAASFVKKTGVDTLAVSVGNIHGIYKMKNGAPPLYFDHLKKIREKVKIPLVLHGASGISKEEIKKAIELGVVIVNIDTEIRLTFKKSLAESLGEAEKTEEYDPRKILKPTIEAMKETVKEKIGIFSNQV